MPYKLREGAQPAYYIIKRQNRTIGVLAQVIDVPYLHLRNVLYGKTVPSPDVRKRLPLALGVRLEELFDAELLERTPHPNRGRKQ